MLSVLAERRLREGKSDRTLLATALSTLLASPTFESWRQGAPLDVAQ